MSSADQCLPPSSSNPSLRSRYAVGPTTPPSKLTRHHHILHPSNQRYEGSSKMRYNTSMIMLLLIRYILFNDLIIPGYISMLICERIFSFGRHVHISIPNIDMCFLS